MRYRRPRGTTMTKQYFLSTRQLAEKAGVSSSKIFKDVSLGKLQPERLGDPGRGDLLFKSEEALAYIDEQKKKRARIKASREARSIKPNKKEIECQKPKETMTATEFDKEYIQTLIKVLNDRYSDVILELKVLKNVNSTLVKDIKALRHLCEWMAPDNKKEP